MTVTPAVSAYSTTQANNIQANTGVIWDEGMSPAQVNNSARQNMADLRSFANDLIWFQYGSGTSPVVAPVYVGATQFKISGVDVSTPYHVGRRVKAAGSGTGTIYGTISAVAFSTDTTVTVIWDNGSLSNETLTIYLSQSPVTGGPVSSSSIGCSATNDSAASGKLGEYISANASGVSLSNATNANITSISLTAGDWDISGVVLFSPTSATITSLQSGISSTSATFLAISAGGKSQLSASGIDGSSANYLPTPNYRLSLASTTTVYLIGEANFSAGSISASGYIGARRVR